MLEHTLTIGMNDKNTKKQEMTVEHAKMLISSVIGDCTIKEGATGYYTHEDGTPVIEKSLEVKKFGGSKKDIIENVRVLKELLNQESIVLDTKRSNAIFI